MKTILTLSELKVLRNNLSGTIGFVPTMGALHGGHLSLIDKSTQTCNHTIVSIFINPAQFSEEEDLNTYPQNITNDLRLLNKWNIDAVFLPTNDIMYPNGYSTFVKEDYVSRNLEGDSRPTFFRGVTTIVAKLFNLINPTHAFFGEKDAQQLRVIKKMVTDLNFPIEVVPCSIVREDSGLALSSRNKYLSEESKKSAATIYKALCHGASLLKKGEQNSNKIRKTITKKILNEPLMKIDYISIVDYASFNKVDGKITGKVLLCAAIYCDGVRLIDNICYPPPSDY